MELRQIANTDARAALASSARTAGRLAGAFGVWWLRGLWLGLPRSLRERWFTPREEFLLRFSDRDLVVERNSQPAAFGRPADNWLAPREHVASLPLAALEQHPQAVAEALGPHPSTAMIAVALPDSVRLTRKLVLPTAAEANLESVLYHEIDRLTPFDVSESVFDHVVRSRDPSAGRLTVEFALVDKSSLDRCLAPIRAAGLTPHLVTAVNDDGELLPLNLLQTGPLQRLPSLKTPVRPAFVAAAAVFALAILYLPLIRYQGLLRNLEAATEQQRTLAVEARGARTSTEALAAGGDYLTARRRDYVRPLDVLLELTTALPNDTWLSRLIVNNDGVQMQGESTQTSSVLEIVEQMGSLSAARFQSPVSLSLMTGNEQFVIAADYAEQP
jgi:general secretion pathway protein L